MPFSASSSNRICSEPTKTSAEATEGSRIVAKEVLEVFLGREQIRTFDVWIEVPKLPNQMFQRQRTNGGLESSADQKGPLWIAHRTVRIVLVAMFDMHSCFTGKPGPKQHPIRQFCAVDCDSLCFTARKQPIEK